VLGEDFRVSERHEGGRRIRGDARANPPLVSIVTVVFRDKDELERILRNVFTFDTSEFELIVVDGGSNDGTVELLQQWNEKVDYWLSEADSGIYDAMNKGIAAARGEYVFHLNAGDRLTFIPAERLSMCSKEQADVASFAVMMDRGEKFLPETGFPLKVGNTWHHQGTFYRRTLPPAYDTQYRVYADFDLNQRLFKEGRIVRLFDQTVASHNRDGLSEGWRNFHEVYRIIYRNFGARFVVTAFVWFPYQALRRATKRRLVHLLSLIGRKWPERQSRRAGYK
jgi:glycosyltransferase involved in cell wall biosynthesis